MARTLEELIAKAGAKNRDEEAKRSRKILLEDLTREVEFLRGWAKGKPIRRESTDSTFWRYGKYVSKIDFGMAEAIVAAGRQEVRSPLEGC